MTRPYLKPIRLFSHKAAQHKCGNPPTYYQLIYIESIDRWKCSKCNRFV